MARPSIYSAELAEAICEHLAHGVPLATICEMDEMPSFSTVYRWERENETFRQLSAQARQVGTHYLADDCIRISDDPDLGPADKRVRVDTRLRLIGKWNAKAYGEKIAHVGGGPGDAPIRYANLTDEEIDARLAMLIGSAGEPPSDA